MRVVVSIQLPNEEDTAAGFLRKAAERYPELKIEFEHAWWLAPPMQFPACLAIGIVGIGGIWPFLVNLMAFG